MSTGLYFADDGWHPALVREGRTRLHVTYLAGTGVVHRAIARQEARGIRPLLHRGQPYPVNRMVRKFREIGRTRGITEAAKDELSRAKGGEL